MNPQTDLHRVDPIRVNQEHDFMEWFGKARSLLVSQNLFDADSGIEMHSSSFQRFVRYEQEHSPVIASLASFKRRGTMTIDAAASSHHQ